MPSDLMVFTATIASGGSLSAAIALKGYTPVALVMPAGWDTGNITFQVTHDGESYADLYNDLGSEVTVLSPAASRNIVLPAADWFSGWLGIKLRSGTSGTPVTQTAERQIGIVCRDV